MTEWRVTLAEPDLGTTESEAVSRVLRSRWLTMGEITQTFERKFAEYCGTRHALAVTNGTAALHLACLAAGIGPGDEVICPALTFVATANAVHYCGATPVFADVAGPRDLTISAEAVRRKIRTATRAIMVMHYGGYACDMTAFRQIADQCGLALIEDACHAPGAELQGRKCGAWGDVAGFSFFSNKNLVTGEGGMIVTDDPEIARKARLLRSHGMTATTWDRHQGHAFSYDVTALGFNYRLDEIRAALGLAQLEKLNSANQKRRELAQRYRRQLDEISGLILPFADHPGQSSAHLLPVLLPPDCNRQKFMMKMKELGIQTSIHYPPVHRFHWYRAADIFATQDLQVTEEAGSRVVTLPLHPLLSFEDVDFVCACVSEILAEPTN